MDKLERYLDQVCRGIAGPRSLRKHVREELREHIADAVAGHRAAGLAEEAAIDRALDDFGGPEQVRAELEATHGHRLMGVVIDKAMQWKERTMRSKWFWTTAAHLALLVMIVGQVTLLALTILFIIPKHLHLMRHIGGQVADVELWSHEMLRGALFLSDYGGWIGIAALAAWALFEWRVRSESKPFIRLTAMGIVALVLMVVITFTAGGLLVPWNMVGPRFVTKPTESQLAAHRTQLASAVKTAEWILEENDLKPDDLRVFEHQVSRAVDAVRVLSLQRELSAATDALARAVSVAYRSEGDEIDRYDRERLNDALRSFLDAHARSSGGLSPATAPATTRASP